jgi:hypothetical protein
MSGAYLPSAQKTIFVQEDGEVLLWTATVAESYCPEVSNIAVVTFEVFSKRLSAIVFDLGFE